MSRKLFSYILTLFGIVFMTACVKNDLSEDNGNHELREFRGTVTFNLSTSDVASRTRAVSTKSGASILIDNLWVGIFNTTTGACFGAARYDEMHKLVQSGTLMKDMLRVDFVTRGEELPLAYIVAVANYDGVTTWKGLKLSDILPDFDHRADITWDDIINLDIAAQSAYAGSKGADRNANAPFLVGFFQDAVSLTQNPKIDQFAYATLGPKAIYPAAAADGMDIQLNDAQDDKIYVAAGAICLRRLVSHNTVHLKLNNGYKITDLKYKRFNMPRAVFMLQRRTDTNRYTNFEAWQRHSPNFADHLLTEGDYDPSNPAFPYDCDTDWIPIAVNEWDDMENIEFAFDHFENKHWGAENLQTQNDREALNEDGTFAALCSSQAEAYNNFASYFVLSMHIINKSTGESADITYTLHEGFCNDDDGRIAESPAVKCRDFSSFRNVSYTYNINISGIKEITAHVTSQESGEHPNGQMGSIWKMIYATGPSKSPIPIEGGIFTFDNKYITFSNHPDLGFRIYGRDEQGKSVDICYNMPEGMYTGFAGLWPYGQPQIVDQPNDPAIPQSLLESMQIGSARSGYRTLPAFIEAIANGVIEPTDQYCVSFARYDTPSEGLLGSLMRGIYIFDRNDTHNAVDTDGCSSYHLAYGAEQYPFEQQTLKFDAANILWDNTYYKLATTVANVFATQAPIFYGSECSVIDLRWKHDPRFAGYKISVYNDTYTHPTIVVGPNTIDRYLHDIKGQKVFIYPMSTADFPRSTGTGANNYSFSVTPIVEDDIYTIEGPTVVTHNSNGDDATCIRVCPTLWDISSTKDWKNLAFRNLNNGTEVHYRGLNIFTTLDIGTSSTTGSQICFGGAGNTETRHFYFWASVPGQFAITSKSNSGQDAPERELVIARMDENGSRTNSKGEKYEEVYRSNAMAATSTTYKTQVLELNNNEPTLFRIYALGSINYFKIQFIPAD